MRKLQHLVKLDNAEVKKEERVAAARLNFEQIFEENPSYVAPTQPQQSPNTQANGSTRQSQYMSNGKLKRPTTPNILQPGQAAQGQNQQYNSVQVSRAGAARHNQSVMSEQHQVQQRYDSKSPMRRPESGR